MRRYHHSKSSLFLMELLINLLLFCFLCGCGLMFFTKSYNLSQDATTLHNAVRLTSSVAGIYETGDGSFTSVCEVFPHAKVSGDTLSIYFDEDFLPCEESRAVSYLFAEKTEESADKIRIDFYDVNGQVAYSITACNYAPTTLSEAKEVSEP